MKAGKKFAALVAVGAVVASIGALAACDPKTPDDTDKDKNPPSTAAQIAYQFTGEFTNDTLYGYGYDFHIMFNLLDNNKIAGSGYNSLSVDSRAASENSGFSEKWFRGNWEQTKDEEDQDCLKLTVMYDADAKNQMTGGSLTNTSVYFVYKKAGSEQLSDFKLQTPIFSGTTEYMTDMSQNTTPYNTADDFIKANLYTWTEPTGYEAMFQSTSDSSAARIYLMPDGKANLYSGKKDPANNEVKYFAGEKWSWTYKDGELKLANADKTATYSAVIDGPSATLEYTLNLQGHEIPYKYTCADISGLTESGEIEEPAQPMVTFNGSNNAKIDVFDDGTAKLSAFGMLNVNFTWEYSDGSLVFTDSVNAEKTYTAVITGSAASVTYSDTLVGNPISIEFSCDDISKIIATDPIAVFNGAGGATLEIYANNKAKASFYGGAMNINFTWTFESNVLTLTDAVNTSKVYTSATEDTVTTIAIKDGYANDTFTLDLSLLA